jgi:hypothetical protein
LHLINHLDAPKLTTVHLSGILIAHGVAPEISQNIEMTLEIRPGDMTQTLQSITRLELVRIRLYDQHLFYPSIFCGAFPALRDLHLAWTVLESGVLPLCQPCTLRSLELHRCGGVTGADLLNFAEGGSRDFELSIGECPDVSNDDINKIAAVIKVARLMEEENE